MKGSEIILRDMLEKFVNSHLNGTLYFIIASFFVILIVTYLTPVLLNKLFLKNKINEFCKMINRDSKEFLYVGGFWPRNIFSLVEMVKETEVTTPEAEIAKRILLEPVLKLVNFSQLVVLLGTVISMIFSLFFLVFVVAPF